MLERSKQMAWWGSAEEPKEEEDLGFIGNTWRTTSNGVVYGATKTKDGFVWVAVGTLTTIGDGFTWCGDTCSWAYNGTTSWVGENMGCGGGTAGQ